MPGSPDRWCAGPTTLRFPTHCSRVWRYHPFFNNTDPPVEAADVTHRQHAIIETMFADIIDGPPAHIPAGRFGSNSASVPCAAIAETCCPPLASSLETGISEPGSTLRRNSVNLPGSTDWSPTSTGRAPTHPLALVTGLDSAVAEHHRT